MDSDLLEILQVETEPDCQVLWRPVQKAVNANDERTLGDALFVATGKLFLNSVRLLLEAKVSPNIKSEYEQTPLHLCSANKQGTEMVREFLKHGADVNAQDGFQMTPLHEASKHHCVETMKELLKQGAMVDAVNEDGHTPLIYAICECKDVSSVQVLLDAGANANVIGLEGSTPLLWAMNYRSPQVVRLLLRADADPNIRDDDDLSSLLHLIARDVTLPAKELIRELHKGGARLNQLDIEGFSALHLAVKHHHLEATQELLRLGAAFRMNSLRMRLFEYLETLEDNNIRRPIALEIVRYMFINNPDSLERIRQLLKAKQLGGKFILEQYTCLSEVEALSAMSCDCGKSSVWGSITGHPSCNCDIHQAILKFLFLGRRSNFTDAFCYKLSKEFVVEVNQYLISYFEFKKTKKRLVLPSLCVKEIGKCLSFEDALAFLKDKQLEMSATECERFMAYVKGESVKSSCEIRPPSPKRLRVSERLRTMNNKK